MLLIDIIIANIGLLSLVRRRENGVPPLIMITCVALFLLVHRCLVIWLLGLGLGLGLGLKVK